MAQAWIRDLQQGADWLAAMLRENCYSILRGRGAPLLAVSANTGTVEVPTLRRGEGETWLFLAPPSAAAFVNGRRLSLGIRVLRDRDEILLPNSLPSDPPDTEPQRIFFSTERLAIVEPFPGGKKPVFCSRCKQIIEEGQLSVRCPSGRCGIWHHETVDQPCWTYSDKCSNCDQATALDAGYRWTPEML